MRNGGLLGDVRKAFRLEPRVVKELEHAGAHQAGSSIYPLLDARNRGDRRESALELLVGGDVVLQLAAVELVVGDHVEIPGSGEPEEDRLRLADLAAPLRLAHGHKDCMRAFGRGQDGF